MRKRYTQIKLPFPNDHDPHPRLLVDGYGIHAGESFRARFPDGWHDITLEVAWEIERDVNLRSIFGRML